MREKLLSSIRAGNYLETAAAFVGISKTTLYKWLRRGSRASSGEFREFVDAVEKAMADAEVRDVALIGAAAARNWQAAAWRLERKFPARWGRKDKVEHSGAVETKTALTIKVIPKRETDPKTGKPVEAK